MYAIPKPHHHVPTFFFSERSYPLRKGRQSAYSKPFSQERKTIKINNGRFLE